MFKKRKKIKLILIVIVLLIISAAIGLFKHRESFFDIRTIYGKIDIGGYGLFVNCHGQGRPTIIFESGLGGPEENSKQNWIEVQREISKITRTFSYDRAGLCDSDSSKLRRTSLNQVHELHTLLKNARVKAPYIIVAHSIGGYNARLFAGTYPKEVAGIVFVDCSHENQFDDIMKHLSSTQIDAMKNQYANTEQTFDDMLLSAKQVKEIRKKDALRNMPIIVLTADHNGKEIYDGYGKAWIKLQDDIASLSNKSKHIFIKNCDHYIQIKKPQIVIEAIKEIINEL
jgi:pimeloyl-ACP methyl ester carboxylesterase